MIDGTFTGTGESAPLTINGLATLSLSGFGSATVKLQRSFDVGATWKDVESFTENTEANVRGTGERFRLNCSVFSSGPIAYYLGKPA